MFKETPEGQTNHCSHTTDNSICDACLGKPLCENCKKTLSKFFGFPGAFYCDDEECEVYSFLRFFE